MSVEKIPSPTRSQGIGRHVALLGRMRRRPALLLVPAIAVVVLISMFIAGPDEASRTSAEVTVPISGSDPGSVAGSVTNGSRPVSASSGEPQANRIRSAPEYDFTWPVAGSISQGMSSVHPAGIDIRAGIGDAVRTVRAGRVTFAGGNPCCVYGYYVTVEHEDGWSSLYAHMSTISVAAGDRVEQRDLVGLAGDTGKADGAHLHFELLSSGGRVNPLSYLEPRRYYIPVSASEAEPTDIAEPAPTATASEQAISAAVRWMARQGQGGYAVDRGSCFAFATGPNWSVSCSAIPSACEGTDECERLFEACVVGPLLLVEAICSGY